MVLRADHIALNARSRRRTVKAAIKPAALLAGVFALAFGIAPAADAQDKPWWEASNCAGMKGVSWIECQKAVSRNKRDRKSGRPPSNQAWWNESKCLGLEGLNWSRCQLARKQGGGPSARARDPWVEGKCIGLSGLAFIECEKDRKQRRR
jgi:hypothetical protein